MGSFQGCFAPLAASRLGAAAMQSAVERAGLAPGDIDEVIMGNVLSAGQGQAPARQAALGAGLPDTVPCTTINKMCGSGMKAAMLGHDLLIAESSQIMVAGGMESMTNAPYLLNRARGGLRMGHDRLVDHMFHDGLEDAYETGRLMGSFAEDCARKYGFDRAEQDAFAVRSLERARKASESGIFDREIASVKVSTRSQDMTIDRDEQPFKADMDRIPHLRPAFKSDGTVTAANSSSISDGAAALVLMRESSARSRGLEPQARIIAHATHAQAPCWFTTAPSQAISILLERIGWRIGDVDLFEVNEAFAVVTMAAMHDHDIPAGKINVHGGACALGHPIGASGARILVTLIHTLQRYNLKRGIASLCIGGGEATAIAVEYCQDTA